MKILVFGAGIPGCNLARGSWAEEIQKNGLRIKDKFSPRMCCSLFMPPCPESWCCSCTEAK